MNGSKDTAPDFTTDPDTKSNQVIEYFFTGPSFRSERVTASYDPRQLYHREPMELGNKVPNSTSLHLDTFSGIPGTLWKGNSYNIKLHYRFIDPDFLQRIIDPRQMYIVDPSVAETATMASPTDDTKRVLLAGDVSLPMPPGSSYPQVMYRVMRDLGKATGLEVRFTATGTREN